MSDILRFIVTGAASGIAYFLAHSLFFRPASTPSPPSSSSSSSNSLVDSLHGYEALGDAGVVSSFEFKPSHSPSSFSLILPASSDDAQDIMNTSNDAFMADTFFKKEAYYARFTLQNVQDLQHAKQSLFLVARRGGNREGGEIATQIVGSLYYTWNHALTPSSADPNTVCVTTTGHFSAVSVPSKYGKTGIGRSLVEAAEVLTRALGQEATQRVTQRLQARGLLTKGRTAVDTRCVLEMGVINLRPDLYAWYEKQGFRRSHRLPYDAELNRIISAEYFDKVYCELFLKHV